MSRRTRCPLELRRSLTRAALLFLGPFHVVSKYGGKGSCSASVMTAAARMAVTVLWHGS